MTWLLIALLFTVSGARAASVDKELATKFAENWLKAAGNALDSGVGAAAVGDIEEFKNADGAVLGYIVSLEPKGFIVISADDRINPVVMISKDGAFDANPQNPLVAMLYTDLTNRMVAAEKIAPANQTRGEIPEGIQQNQATWARFTTSATRAAGIAAENESAPATAEDATLTVFFAADSPKTAFLVASGKTSPCQLAATPHVALPAPVHSAVSVSGAASLAASKRMVVLPVPESYVVVSFACLPSESAAA